MVAGAGWLGLQPRIVMLLEYYFSSGISLSFAKALKYVHEPGIIYLPRSLV